jgi:copper(I)-binding protein
MRILKLNIQQISKYLLSSAVIFLTNAAVIAEQDDSLAISVIDGYIREMPPGQDITAAFMTLKNSTLGMCRLTMASSIIAEKIEIHGHFYKDGMMSMRPIEGIDIPPKKSISLKPGGYHLMLFGLKEELKKNAQHEITLNFLGCPTSTFKADVRSVLQHKHHH